MIEATTKKGTKVWLAFNPDCEENEGGWFVEVYLDPALDYDDYFCIHPEDCDCKDPDAVEAYAKWFVETAIAEY